MAMTVLAKDLKGDNDNKESDKKKEHEIEELLQKNRKNIHIYLYYLSLLFKCPVVYNMKHRSGSNE